jgi:hypothetical protein
MTSSTPVPAAALDIRYGAPARPSRLRGNSYATSYTAEREAALLELRERFRHVRRVLVTFASGQRYVQHQRTLTASAAMTGEFHTIEAWSFDQLRRTPFFAENRDILQRSRGQGYWLWKPYLIARALESSEDGDLIAYNDCLPEDGNVFGRSILPTLAWLSEGERRLAIARKPAPNSAWTKRDCFVHMECDAPAYWEQDQLIATYMAFVASPSTRRLVADWLAFCRDARILTDEPNTCGLDDFPDFQDHRHDQSVLSNLVIRDGFTLPNVLFGREITTKHFQDMLGVFEDALVGARLREGCVSLGKPWTQSSPSIWSPERGVMAEPAEGRDFFFHTEQETAPWWLLDLEGVHRVDRIEIHNRPAPRFAWRANRMRVFVGPSLDSLHLAFDAVTAEWDALTPIVLKLENEMVRFVRIALDNDAILHLKDVKVFGTIA